MPPKLKSLKLRLLWLLPILFAISGCGIVLTPPKPIPARQIVQNSYCKLAQPISYDTVHDSPATVRQIEVHNSKWVCECENDCPVASPSTK